MALKRQAMDWQAGNFIASDKGRALLDAYLDSKPLSRDYARFRATVERLGPNWHEWPDKQRSGELTPQDHDPRAMNYHSYAQWRVDTQLGSLATAAKAKNVSLYLDLPVGVHARGYDAWRYQDLFVKAMSVGAPPDPVTTSGQNWGFPPIDPDALRNSCYSYLRDYLRHHLSVAGVLRLDHVMGLHRLYWIPAGGSARDGLYVSNAYEELYAVHSLEAYRHDAVIIGEDLGVASRELPRNLDRRGVTRLYVVEISLLGPPEEPLTPIPRRVAASIGTHDLPPFASWWQDLDIEGRRALGVLSHDRARMESEEREPKRRQLIAYLRKQGLLAPDALGLQDVLRALLCFLGSSAADWLVVNLEDLWLETQPQNVPGTTDDQHPNWRHRAAHGLDELDALPDVVETLAAVRQARRRM
jgi:4-alpha-glucanotransferase